MDNTINLIPVRMKATRFPNKPFALIGGLPMFHYVYQKAVNIFPNTYLAICDHEVHKYCEQKNLKYVMTDPNHLSGSDRIGEAIRLLESQLNFDKVINIQGDMPFIKKDHLLKLNLKLDDFKMTTLACPFVNLEEAQNTSKVKVKISGKDNLVADNFFRDFSNQFKLNEDTFHHIGVYGYQKSFLREYISLPPTHREKEEKLEQLRVIDKIKINVSLIDEEILGVDTKEDLDRVNRLIQNNV